MIQIENKQKCTGCSACVQTCPKQCISFEEDEQGFRYPCVNQELCIDCGLCEKVCPCINENEQIMPLDIYAAKNPDKEIRKKSSSGGFFTMLAESIIDEGGVVFGARFNKKYNVIHDYTETKDGIEAFRGSKYVQSIIGDTYKQARDFLKAGRKVLFSGTPCQIAGLRLFLRKDYENLYTVDFICHGVPSPGVFRWYLQEEINNYAARKSSKKIQSCSSPIHSIPKGDVLLPEGISIEGIRFRDKREGWKKFSFVLLLAEASADGKKNTVLLSSNVCENTFLKGFCSDLYLRPSCHTCPSRDFRSGSGITIADFWGQEYMFPEFDNDTGVSSVIIKTEKGRYLLSLLKDPIIERKNIDQILLYNPSLVSSKPAPSQSRKFWNMPLNMTFEARVDKARTISFWKRVYIKLKSYIDK